MIKTPLSVVRVAAFCLPLALVASCGDGSEAVQGTRVNISPVSVGVSSSPTGTPTDVAYIIQTYQIELRTPTGFPQIGTEVTIVNRGRLYAGSVVIDPINVLCSGDYSAGQSADCLDTTKTALPGSYVTTTDSNGSVRVTMIYAFFPGIDGTVTVIEAFSGTGYGKSDIEFTCVNGAVDCP